MARGAPVLTGTMRLAKIVTACGLLMLSVGIRAQDATYTVSGSVVNSVTGEPIPHALVQLVGRNGDAELTDADGHFEFDGLSGARAGVVARKPGFFSELEASDGQGMFAPTRVALQADTPSVVVKLVPESVIFGHVTSNGEPMENVPVKLLRMHVFDGLRRWELSGNTTSDADGEFRIANLIPGTYLAAFGPGSEGGTPMTGSTTRGRGYAEIFFPSAADLASAAPIELVAGQQFEADVSIKSGVMYRLSGTVSGYSPELPVTLMLITNAGETLPLQVAFNEKSGQFQAETSAGSYTLRAEQFAQESTSQADSPIAINSDTAGIRLVLQPAASIPVNVRTEVSDAHSKAMAQSGAPVSVRLTSSVPSFSALEYVSMPDGPPNHSQMIRDVDPGKYYADVSAQDPYYVQSAQCGGVDLLHDDLSIVAGSRVAPIEVVLRDDGGTVTGTVNNGDAPRGAVFLVSDRNPRQTRMSPERGSFRFTAVAPGDYSVFAIDNGRRLEYTNPEALAPYLAKAAHVTVSPNGGVSVPSLELANTDAVNAAK